MMGLSLLAFANTMFSAEGGTKRLRITTPSGLVYVVEQSASGTFTVVDVLANVTKNGVTSQISIAPQGVNGSTVSGISVSGDNVSVGTLSFTPSGSTTALTATQVAASLNAAVTATGGTAPTFTAANVTSGSGTIVPATSVVPPDTTPVTSVDPAIRNVSASN